MKNAILVMCSMLSFSIMASASEPTTADLLRVLNVTLLAIVPVVHS
jgi:hypothetical protein